MNFNFYGLPEFVSYSILLGIALALIRQKREIRLRYWLAGWLLILLHAGIFMLLPQSFPFDVLARGNLVLAGQLFILAAYYQGPATIHSSRLISRVGVAGALNLTFAVASAAYAELHPGSQQMAPFYLLTALGAAGTIWLAAATAWKPPGIPGSPSRWLGRPTRCRPGPCMPMACPVAYFFLRQTPKLTMGVVFILWGLVFPVYSLLILHAPAISAHIGAEIWNLPKFLAAASMMLVLLEERISLATHLAGHDTLTGLPNRRLYADRFEQAVLKPSATTADSAFW
ncbi:GGDEF domain-containing protein [Chromobacterium sphagni]|uniref:Histidine kinase N-terminal 7TM region domain-containing protein n=1 Tax=Chromobacterium sphagni TaxID=1903179 RepID=A0ABX3C9R4_9NEIS|nr:GGDEF domain-containing protein [Chromobacterium sphagni]OHX18884.1 hypothetical protein BI344_19870 [Chromobacterium sphagni]